MREQSLIGDRIVLSLSESTPTICCCHSSSTSLFEAQIAFRFALFQR